MRRLYALLAGLSLLGALQGCAHHVAGICDCDCCMGCQDYGLCCCGGNPHGTVISSTTLPSTTGPEALPMKEMPKEVPMEAPKETIKLPKEEGKKIDAPKE